MATNFLESATTLKHLGAKWLPEKKVNFTPCRETRDSHSQKPMSSSDKRVSPIQHFSSFPVQNSLLHLWNISSFVTRQFLQTQFPGSSVKGLEVKNLSLRNCLVFITVLGEKLVQNNQSLQNLCFWGCQEAALSVIWHNRFFCCFFFVEKKLRLCRFRC